MTGTSSALPRAGKIFVGTVIVAGGVILALSVVRLWADRTSPEWLFLAGLALLSGAFTIRVPAVPARISVSEAFVFTTVLLYGPSAATVVVCLIRFGGRFRYAA